ncbi:uncharacterized protein LOC118647333, partial [Monomorium pharaonis]|uniref:uncharacterized protein LOC118647333 n=1 Tax=Monomorium pharaonis TaxID=307658 RepID=UPI001746F099
ISRYGKREIYHSCKKLTRVPRWKIASLIRKSWRALTIMYSYQNEFQGIEKKNDLSLHARAVLHAFLSGFKFSKDKFRVDAEEVGDVSVRKFDGHLDLYDKGDVD